MRTSALYLQDIKIAIEKILRFVEGMRYEDFLQDEKTLDSVVRNFEIIGEASKSLPENIRSLAETVPWKKVIRMRNKLIHEYWGVDIEVVWFTIQDDLPALKTEVERLFKEIS